MNGIYWLASYPKSGNTWFRIFLNNLLSDKDEPVDINNMNLYTPMQAAGSFSTNWSAMILPI